MDAGAQVTTVFRRTEDGSAPIWRMPGWFRIAALSNDGDHLVIGYGGGELIPLDFDRTFIILYFYERGELIREVPLGELIGDLASLQRTASHYFWGNFLGFDAHGHYLVATVEGRVFAFDVATGQTVVSGAPHTIADAIDPQGLNRSFVSQRSRP